MTEDKELKEILARMGLSIKAIEKSVHAIEIILTFFLIVFIIFFTIGFFNSL